jgi:hypothetical protein
MTGLMHMFANSSEIVVMLAIVLILATSRAFPELAKRMGRESPGEANEKLFLFVLRALAIAALVVLLLGWLVP